MGIFQISDATNESFQFLVHANDKSERICMLYLKFALGGFFSSTITMAMTSVLFCRLTNKTFELQHLYLPYRTTWAMHFFSIMKIQENQIEFILTQINSVKLLIVYRGMKIRQSVMQQWYSAIYVSGKRI